ncbi:MAG: efflux RND transporter permease subunit [Alphaproteobacteria bacterium]
MILSDVSVRRPVFAAVLSLMLITLGVLSADQLSVREYPDIDAPVVSVVTVYKGASAATVETRVTQALEDAVAGIEGIRWISSSSEDGRSRVRIEFNISRDIDAAANDVRDRVSRVIDRLPGEVDAPEIFKVDSDEDAIMWFNLNSTNMNVLELTDYADRFLVDRLSAVDGVARVRIGGAQRYAMRIWIDRVALAARGLTVADVEQALREENIELPAGALESTARDLTLRMKRAYLTVDDFQQLVIAKGSDGHLIRLAEIAEVEFGAEEPRIFFNGNGKPQIGLGIVKQSTANTLDVARGAKAEIKRLEPTLPEGMTFHYSYDGSVFIEESIEQVYLTLGIAILLVVAVIYIFLGNVRATIVPAVTVPVSLIASFIVLYAFGYSINLLTLLALVLAIGLVVDDAIVVLENIYRRVQRGEPPLLAAYRGARQVAFAVIATTIVLISVFVPILFLEGNVGRLFAELAVAVAAAVIFSSIVALSLCPMLASRMIKPAGEDKGRLREMIDSAFASLSRVYGIGLEKAIAYPWVVGVAVLGVFASIYFVNEEIAEELAPAEDRGAFFIRVQGPEGAGFDYTVEQLLKVEAILLPLIDAGEARRVLIRAPASFNSVNNFDGGFGIIVLEPWERRERSTMEIIMDLNQKLAAVPGVRAMLFPRSGLGGGASRPVQFVIGAGSYEDLAEYRDIILDKARENPNLLSLDWDYRETKPQIEVSIDRNRAADLGVRVEEIQRTLETMVGSREVTTVIRDGEEYDVVLQGRRADRQDASDLSNLYVRSGQTGALIPLSNLVSLREFADAKALERYNRYRAVTISAGLADGYPLSEALAFLEDIVATELPEDVQIGYKGESLEYKEGRGQIYFTFILAIVIVYLVLAAQFESFIHPFIILLAVPMALLGALLGLWIAGETLNIYSQVGIIILVGIAAKNGILLVEFANQLRDAGRDLRTATLEAAQIRLRPIIMTGLSTTFGSLPLVFASGAGAESRVTIGVAIFGGVLVATMLTLFVVPVFYHLLARYTSSPKTVARKLESMQETQA